MRELQAPNGAPVRIVLGKPKNLGATDSLGRRRSPSGASLIRHVAATTACENCTSSLCQPRRIADGRTTCSGCGRWYSVSHTTRSHEVSTAVAISDRPVGIDVQYERQRAGAMRALGRMVGRDASSVGWPDWVATEALIKAEGRASLVPAPGTVNLPPMIDQVGWTQSEEGWHVLVELLEPGLWLAVVVQN